MDRMRVVRYGAWACRGVMVVITCLLPFGSAIAQSADAAMKFRSPQFMRRCMELPVEQIERIAVLGNVERIASIIASAGGRVVTSTRTVVTALASVGAIRELMNDPGVISIAQGWKERSRPSTQEGGEDTNRFVYRPLPIISVDPAHREYGVRQGAIEAVNSARRPLTRSYDGEGVLVGIIENALIDFRHPDFLEADGSSRFVEIWDQRSTGTPPHQFGYGTLWSPEALNREIRGETRDYDESPEAAEHVTQVAGVAVGNGFATGRYCGVAPRARIAHVAVLYSETNLIDAVRYIFALADSLGMPCVINLSMQIAQDVSDGSNIASVAVSDMVREKSGRIVVSSAGNNGHILRHFSYDGRRDGPRQYWLRCSPSKRRYGIDSIYFHHVRLSRRDAHALRLSFGAVVIDTLNRVEEETIATNGRTIADLARFGTAIAVVRSRAPYDTLFEISASTANLTDTTIAVELAIRDRRGEIRDSLPGGGDGYQEMLAVGVDGNGAFEAWSEYFLVAVGATWNDRFMALPERYLPPDNLNSIDPPADGDGVIAVGGYINQMEFVDVDGRMIRYNSDFDDSVPHLGAIYSTTQPGAVRDGYWSPVVVTPGIGVAAPLPLGLPPVTDPRPYGSPRLWGNLHGVFNGTSSASPVLAGAAALFLQKNPTASFQDFRRALIETSQADVETGPVPNSRVGYGKIDFFGLLCWKSGASTTASTGATTKE